LDGVCPEWFQTVRAARAIGCLPWEYAGMPETSACIIWREWVWAVDTAEAEARKVVADAEERNAARKRR
jgi:hypothetical protein